MHMAVDATGHHAHPGRVDVLPALAQVQPDGHDLAVADAHIRPRGIRRSHDRAAPDHQVKVLHDVPFPCIITSSPSGEAYVRIERPYRSQGKQQGTR